MEFCDILSLSGPPKTRCVRVNCLADISSTRSGARTRISSLRGWCTNLLYDPSNETSDLAQKSRSLARRSVIRLPCGKSNRCRLFLASGVSLHCTCVRVKSPSAPIAKVRLHFTIPLSAVTSDACLRHLCPSS